MKSLFNLIAVGINASVASRRAFMVVLHNQGGAIVPFLKDIRESFLHSNLPAAIEGLIHFTAEMSNVEDPAWQKEAESEMKLLQKQFKAFGKELDGIETAYSNNKPKQPTA